jgi:type IV pilus assembly protein PilB
MDEIEVAVDLMQVVSGEQAWHYHIVPFKNDSSSLGFFTKPGNVVVKRELEILFGKNIELEEKDAGVILKALTRFYRKGQGGNTVGKFEYTGSDSDDILIKLITEAQKADSSDIHLEPYENKCRIRFRIDGLLVERYSISKDDFPGLINKIKIKANLDISEKRLPQDGRIFIKGQDKKLDLRVSVLPTLYGEKAVLRLLNSDIYEIDLKKVGFTESQFSIYTKAISKPNGIILISGPTGSGKTTTLYSTLKLLNKASKNVLTIEDPVEYTLEGINQVQLKESIGLTFPKALRTFLRQDPDVIMVGEIRDRETAEMAIRASLTGHLVLSTIHTNSAIGTINRLIDMGIPSFLISDTLQLSLAQRLIRLLCPYCKSNNISIDEIFVPYLKINNMENTYSAVGCEKCYHTGYKGRIGIFEIIEIDSDAKEAIKHNQFIQSSLSYKSLKDSAVELVKEGKTSMEEVFSLIA